MKEKLREKHLPPSYHQRLLDQWQKLTQDGKPVVDYITKFDEYFLKCGVIKDTSITLSQFRVGLHDSIQRELYLQDVTTLEHASQVARDVERFQRSTQPRPPLYRPIHPRGPKVPERREPLLHPLNRPLGPPPRNALAPMTQTIPTRTTTVGRYDDKGKGVVTNNPPQAIRYQNHYFRCHEVGHYANQCPSHALFLRDPQVEEGVEVQEYEPESALI